MKTTVFSKAIAIGQTGRAMVTSSTRRSVLRLIAGVIPGALPAYQPELPDLAGVPADLVVPPVEAAAPARGKRVRQQLPAYAGTGVHHALYLPRDWSRNKLYPVIVEYAGNGNFKNQYGDVSDGSVEGSKAGYGISGGTGFIWVCMPYVNRAQGINQPVWWGDVQATVEYCKEAVRDVCERFGGDPSAVILTGFSRGAIACNYLGLHDDSIADLWLAFIPYSHYDGVITTWPYPAADRASALERLKRLKGRAVFLCQEKSIDDSRAYVESTGFAASFTFQPIHFHNHNDAWTLRDIPERRAVRQWLAKVLQDRPGTHSISGRVTGPNGRGLPGARVESGTHWTVTRRDGTYVLRGLIDGVRDLQARVGGATVSLTVELAGQDRTAPDLHLPLRRVRS